MNVMSFETEEKLDQGVAEAIYQVAKEKPNAILCLAAGDTPVKTFTLLTKMPRAKEVFKDIQFVGLDEWVGLSKSDAGSCRYTLNHYLFEPLAIPEDHIHFFDGAAQDLNSELTNMNTFLAKNGPIDLMLLGIGLNGHIGFNEPGASFESYAHVIQLDKTTQTVGQKYFQSEQSLNKGITLGLKHVMESQHVILMAKGTKKRDIIHQALDGDVTEAVPASILQHHSNSEVMVDHLTLELK